jgi:capsular polysaccharide transport system permease protein
VLGNEDRALAAAQGLATSLKIQLRVIGALVLREMRVRFGRSQLGYLWAIADPLAYIVAFSAMFYFLDRHPPFGNSMALFFATGILPFIMFRNLGNQVAAAFNSNQALLTYPIVQPIDTAVARGILEVATAILIMIIVFGGLYLATNIPRPGNILRMLEALSLLALFGFGIGLISAVIITHIASWQNVFRMLMTPMLFLSGIFYSLDSLPSHLREYLAWNPVLHGVEMFRSGYYANYRAPDFDVFYLLFCSLFVTFLALAMERTMRGRIE